MKKVLKLVSLLLVVLLCGAFAFGCGGKGITVDEIKSRGKLIMATNAEFPPFEFKEGDKFTGVDVEIAEKIAEALGVELQIDNMDFDSVVSSVGQGKADVALAGLTVNETRKESVDFSSSYYKSAQYVIVMKENTAFDGLDKDGIDAAIKAMGADAKIGYQAGTTGSLYANGSDDMGFEGFSDAVKKSYPNAALAVTDMINGNINMVIVDEEPAKMIVAGSGKVKYLDVKLSDENYAIGIRKNSPELLEAVNKVLADMSKDGTLEAIFAKYFAE